MSLSSLAQQLRLAHGLRWVGKYPPFPWRSFTAAALAVTAYAAVAQIDNLSERVQIMERVTEIYEAKVSALEACEAGKSVGYYYQDGRTFECAKPL